MMIITGTGVDICIDKGIYKLRDTSGEEDTFELGRFEEIEDVFIYIDSIRDAKMSPLVTRVAEGIEMRQITPHYMIISETAGWRNRIWVKELNGATISEAIETAISLEMAIGIQTGAGYEGITYSFDQTNLQFYIKPATPQPEIIKTINSNFARECGVYLDEEGYLVYCYIDIDRKQLVQQKLNDTPTMINNARHLLWENGLEASPQHRHYHSTVITELHVGLLLSKLGGRGTAESIRIIDGRWEVSVPQERRSQIIIENKYDTTPLPTALDENISEVQADYAGENLFIAGNLYWIRLGETWVETSSSWIEVFAPKEIQEEYATYENMQGLLSKQ